MADRVQDRFQVNAGKVAQIILNTVIVGKPNNPGLPDPKDIQLATDTIKSVASEIVIEAFFERSYPYWPALSEKQKDTLISSADRMMPEFSSQNISTFKLLFTAKLPNGNILISEEILESLWAYFHQMVRQCIAYGLNKMGNKDNLTIGNLKLTKPELTNLKSTWDQLKDGKNIRIK